MIVEVQRRSYVFFGNKDAGRVGNLLAGAAEAGAEEERLNVSVVLLGDEPIHVVVGQVGHGATEALHRHGG